MPQRSYNREHTKDAKPSKRVILPIGLEEYQELSGNRLGEWRVLYVARFRNAIYVFHAFRKKTQKTRREDIELARQRYRQVEE